MKRELDATGWNWCVKQSYPHETAQSNIYEDGYLEASCAHNLTAFHKRALNEGTVVVHA
jgi:hypothetical protein